MYAQSVPEMCKDKVTAWISEVWSMRVATVLVRQAKVQVGWVEGGNRVGNSMPDDKSLQQGCASKSAKSATHLNHPLEAHQMHHTLTCFVLGLFGLLEHGEHHRLLQAEQRKDGKDVAITYALDGILERLVDFCNGQLLVVHDIDNRGSAKKQGMQGGRA